MMHSEHGLSMPYVICDVPDQAFGSGGILVQVVRQSLSRIERARCGGLEYGVRQPYHCARFRKAGCGRTTA